MIPDVSSECMGMGEENVLKWRKLARERSSFE